MRDFNEAEFEMTGPGRGSNLPAEQTISFCLDKLFADKEHSVGDIVSDGLSYEELIGSLLDARRELAELSE